MTIKDIDCHILTLPHFKREWVRQLKNDLDSEPINQHWLAGIDGNLGQSRAQGYEIGKSSFVTSVDPDDRITLGTFAALHQALLENPSAPFAWAGEQFADEELSPISKPNIWPHGYSPFLHLTRGHHVHGVKLYRRELVTPLLGVIRNGGLACEFLLDYLLVKPFANPPKDAWPIHIPMVGRVWRQHQSNGHKLFTNSDFDHIAQILGFHSMSELKSIGARAYAHPL